MDWDQGDDDYSYYLNGMLNELFYTIPYEVEDQYDALTQLYYDPETAVVEAPGVLRVDSNVWLDELPDYPPMYFISLDSEDPGAGCWISLYQNLPETVLHAASVTEEELAALQEEAFLQDLESRGVKLSEGELILDDVDYKALRNQLIRNYLKDSTMYSSLYSALDEVEANPYDKTPNGVIIVCWEEPNAKMVFWHCPELTDTWQSVQVEASANGGATEEMLQRLCYDPDNVEMLDDSIFRSESNEWLGRAGGSMIWMSIESTDPHSGIWAGFYGPIPPVIWEGAEA